MRRALAVIALFAAVLGVTLWRARGPAPLPLHAPPDRFSAARAFAALRATVGGTRPHPIGSAENRHVRDRIAGRLRALGYEVRITRSFACNAYGTCGSVENIVAHLPQRTKSAAVMLAAHYDSVPAGPGASDDGAGVATLLEIARIVRSEPTRNPVVFLIDDGEEAGLLGAEAFVQTPEAKAIGAVINLEARGTSGSSFLFETSRGNGWFIPRVAGALRRPMTTSLFASIYDMLPNDTDLTIFKRAGLTGINFAFIGGVTRYHTALDDLRHVDLRSLQHHGDNALDALRVFGNADLTGHSPENAVWFDLLGFTIVSWPAAWTVAIAALCGLLALAACGFVVRRGLASWREIALAALSMIASLAVAFGLGLVLARIAGLRQAATWPAHRAPQLIAMWTCGFAVAFAFAGARVRRSRFDSVFAGQALVWTALAAVVSSVLPGGSYLLLVPALTLSLALLARAAGSRNAPALSLVSAAVAAILYFPLLAQIDDALGTPALPLIAMAAALVASTAAPLFATRWSVAAGTLAAAVVLALLANALPAYTKDSPRRLSISYLDGEWIADAPLAGFRPRRLFPWSRRDSYVAPAPHVELPAVTITRLSENEYRVASRRNAYRVSAVVRGPAGSIAINGVTPPPPPPRFVRTLPPGYLRASVWGSEMTLTIRRSGSGPIEIVAFDYTEGLPAAPPLRPASAIAWSEPDTTITMQKGPPSGGP
jgi:hypothetical protein